MAEHAFNIDALNALLAETKANAQAIAAIGAKLDTIAALLTEIRDNGAPTDNDAIDIL